MRQVTYLIAGAAILSGAASAFAGEITVTNQNCRTAEWFQMKPYASFHVYDSRDGPSTDLCTITWVTLNAGTSQVITIRDSFPDIDGPIACLYTVEAKGTAFNPPALASGGQALCREDWAGVCQCALSN